MDSTEYPGAAARGRRLVQHAAVLLYAGRPLDSFLSRLQRVLRQALAARWLLVWLANEQGELQPRYGAPAGEAQQRARQCALNRRSIVIREGEHSELYAPVTYGNDLLGVAAVISANGTAYTDDDLRLFEALTHYMAISIGNQPLVQSVLAPYRRVRLFAVALCVAAVLASFVLGGYTIVHGNDMRQTARREAQVHVRGVAERLDANANDAGQLARSLAVLGATITGNRARTEVLLAHMLRSAPAATIYGAGLWYAPHAFDGRTRLFGPYVHRGKTDVRRIILTYMWSSARYDYPRQPWYTLAQRSPGTTHFTPPYFDTDLTYVTAAQAMVQSNGRFMGVATVDMSLPYLQRFINAASSGSQVFSVTAAAGKHTLVPAPWKIGGATLDVSAPVRLVGWRLHETQSADGLNRSLLALWVVSGLAILALWMSAGLGIAALFHSRDQLVERISVELERSRMRNEVEQRLAAEQRLVETSKKDPLTGLPARVALLDAIAAALEERRTDPRAQYAVAFIDLDRFSNVNEALGHSKGDEVLRALGERLANSGGPNSIVGRYGGDEFLVVKRISAPFDAIRLAQSVLSSLGDAFAAGGESVFVRASMGIVIPDDSYRSPEEVVRDADIAMYHAKSKGTLRFEIFTAEMRAQAEQRVRMEGQLRHAVTRDDFFVEYQPIVRLDGGRIEGFEALVRWRPEQHDTRYPAEFVESAERIGAIVPIDFKVLESVRRAIGAWPARNGGAVFVAVNMSALHFATRGLAEQLVRAVRSLRFPSDALHIEITETALMRDRDVATETLAELRGAGVRVSIDDFGTGYSSLAYVERFRVDALKIDKSFVETMAQRSEAAEIVRAVSALGRALGLEVIAEGVETAEQVELLREAGVTSGQGFAFSRPVPPERVPRLLECGVALAR